MTVEYKGTQFKLNFSFLFVSTLMLILCEEKIVLMCLTSSLLHEGGHLLFMHLFRQRVISVDFGAFGVRIERSVRTNLSYKKEAVIALGGIMINFLLAFFSVLYYYFSRQTVALEYAFVNVFIALFNMIPVSMLDMGRAISCLLAELYEENTAGKILERISFIFLNCLIIFCGVYCIFVNINFSLIFVSIYLYIITLMKKWS